MVAPNMQFFDFLEEIFRDEWKFELSSAQKHRWADALKYYDLERVKKSFNHYLRSSKFAARAPKESDILTILKEIPADLSKERCAFDECGFHGDERVGEYFYCRRHADDMILRLRPDSLQADCVREARKFEAEAKRLGRTNRDHFEALYPDLIKRLEKSEKLNNQRIFTKEERPKSATEIFYESTSRRVSNSEISLDDIPF